MRWAIATLAVVACAALLAAAPASAEFGIKDPQVTFEGPQATEAGAHPFSVTTSFEVNTKTVSGGKVVPDGEFKDLVVDLPPGFVGSATPVPYCASADFFFSAASDEPGAQSKCPDSSAIGVAEVTVDRNPKDPGSEEFLSEAESAPVFLLEPPPGAAAKFGFTYVGFPVTVVVGVNPEPPYNLQARATNIAQALLFFASRLRIWGVPSDPVHDGERGKCTELFGPSGGSCPTSLAPEAFLTMPRSCTGPLLTKFEARSWQDPGTWVRELAETPPGMDGCSKLASRFGPDISSKPTNQAAESPTGLNFNLEIEDEGLLDKDGKAESDVKKAVVTLPKGVTVNPSQAEGLGVCSEQALARETAFSDFGAGCPAASKIGSVEVETPLLKGEILHGSIFVAEPFTNRFGSLLAIYQVIKSPKLGIVVKLAGKVEPDPKTGQLVTTFDDLPQLPFSDFRLRFREGGRSPLITPPQCGTYETVGVFTPWANPGLPYTTTSTFEITRGVGGGPCPPAGTPPFAPGLEAGTLNNNAGDFSPFHLRLTRRDGDQDLTKFSSALPPGLVAKLAGTTRCPDAAIASIESRTGREELAAPSCPASSEIGNVITGAGVGSQLTYVPGKVYLAGPYNGAPLSVVGVVPAVAGPFDVGVVATRQALAINPRTAEVRVDGSRSDPIPHILAGIPLKVRDIRATVDRPNFTLNPTSCNPFQIGADLWGGGLDQFSILDDAPVSRSTRFQAANCAHLGFKPSLSMKLKGGARRGAHPALRSVYRPRSGDANLQQLVLRLPQSAFLDQGHIRTICTRVQFAADACPRGAIYGRARAFTPLLDDPLEGPVYLRSSDNDLPDLVAHLQGLVDVEAVARIDSIKGGIRATFEGVPDAAISKVVVRMQGGKKGLIVNSRNLCTRKNRAHGRLDAHNGKRHTLRPLVRSTGCKKKKRRK
ncbi:MAG TPA: hypothetical protein VFY04_08730 [Solirubrobacterales bacterium]|nr:hypothetical protein [Solirubrobacterales bacterium]